MPICSNGRAPIDAPGSAAVIVRIAFEPVVAFDQALVLAAEAGEQAFGRSDPGVALQIVLKLHRLFVSRNCLLLTVLSFARCDAAGALGSKLDLTQAAANLMRLPNRRQ